MHGPGLAEKLAAARFRMTACRRCCSKVVNFLDLTMKTSIAMLPATANKTSAKPKIIARLNQRAEGTSASIAIAQQALSTLHVLRM